jgi:hypothetical protein
MAGSFDGRMHTRGVEQVCKNFFHLLMLSSNFNPLDSPFLILEGQKCSIRILLFFFASLYFHHSFCNFIFLGVVLGECIHLALENWQGLEFIISKFHILG